MKRKTVHDKGKPRETLGRKAIGPEKAASYRKTGFFVVITPWFDYSLPNRRQQNSKKLFADKGKPIGILGRKAIGPEKAASYQRRSRNVKKIMILLVIALLLTTTTLLFANNDKQQEEIPSGVPESISPEGNPAQRAGDAQKAENNPEEDEEDLELRNGMVLINQYNMMLIEDNRGNLHTFESQDFGKENREAREAQALKEAEAEAKAEKEAEKEAAAEKEAQTEKEAAEAKAAEASKNEKSANESSSTPEKASTKSESAGAANTNTASAAKSSQDSNSTAEITNVAATPPRSPNVPSYSMDSIGIYHNDEGAVTVVYPNAPQKRLRVLIEKGGERSAYNLHDGAGTANAVATYPLQRGDGTYLVRIMENTEGNSYREVYRKEVTLKSQQKHAVYLNSIQEINWSSSDPAIQKAAQLTAGMSTDREKVRGVYNYMVRNVKYDHDKVDQLNTFYLPNINSTYSSNKGICYDYASLFAAMLRSQGIPTRMVKGYSDAIGNGEVFHAWNEVYLADEDRWVIIDTTHDASLVQGGQSVDMIKGSGGFSVTHRL